MQSVESIFSAANETVEAERRQYTKPSEPEAAENGAPLSFPVKVMTGAAGYFSDVMAGCMEPLNRKGRANFGKHDSNSKNNWN